MVNPAHGSNGSNGSIGAADGGQQSIGTDGEAPVDGIAGGHPGGIEPAGDDVNAGGLGKGPGRRHEGSEQMDPPGKPGSPRKNN